MQPVLVTGSSGLIGYRVAEQLHHAGVDVLGVDLRPSAAPFPTVTGDVADPALMVRLIADRPNVVHAGAVSGPMLLLDDPAGIAQANLGGTMAVFEACRQAPLRRLVWTSSIAVYGDQPTLAPVPETAPMNPQSFYGHTKAAGEMLLRGYADHYHVPAIALRLSSVFGPRRQTVFGLRTAIEAALAGRPIAVAAEQTSRRQYVHVDDAARAVVLALQAEAPKQLSYNITGGTWVTEAELARMLASHLPGLVIEPGPPAWNEGHLGPLLIDAAWRDLAYQPGVDLADGLAELVASLATPGTRSPRTAAP